MLSEKDEANAEEILYAIKHIEDYTLNINSVESLKENSLVYDAVMMNFILIGEACKRLSKEVKEANNQIDWKGINGYRNFIAHEYFGVDEKIVWSTLKVELPLLKLQITQLINGK